MDAEFESHCESHYKSILKIESHYESDYKSILKILKFESHSDIINPNKTNISLEVTIFCHLFFLFEESNSARCCVRAPTALGLKCC